MKDGETVYKVETAWKCGRGEAVSVSLAFEKSGMRVDFRGAGSPGEEELFAEAGPVKVTAVRRRACSEGPPPGQQCEGRALPSPRAGTLPLQCGP